MARFKSEDRRNAILTSAIEVVAERGVGATTALIAKSAGVAEGTIFTYFNSKDELLNALYCEIKLDLANAMMSDFPRRASIRHRLHHVWNSYVDWGLRKPAQNRALRQIEMWAGLTDASRAAGSAPFVEIEQLGSEATAQRLIRDVPQELVGATIRAFAEMAMELQEKNPANAQKYRDAGFDMLWAAISRKP